jgi:hypothetical protein
MEKSSDYLRPVFEKVLEEMDERDAVYGLAWKEDRGGVPVRYLDAKLQQKAQGVAYIIGNGQIEERVEFMKEVLLDLLGYAAMVYWRISNEDK